MGPPGRVRGLALWLPGLGSGFGCWFVQFMVGGLGYCFGFVG